MNKYKVTVYTWGQPPYITIIEARQYGIYNATAHAPTYTFRGKDGELVADFPVSMTSVELIP